MSPEHKVLFDRNHNHIKYDASDNSHKIMHECTDQ